MDGDVVGRSVALWAEQMPGLDVSASEVLARILRIAQHVEGAENGRLRRRRGRMVANVGDFEVLRALRRIGPPYAMTPSQLRAEMLISSSGLTGRLHRLERDGWITREASADDQRSVLVTLTPEAVSDLDDDIAEHFAFEDDLLAPLTPQQRTDLAALLTLLLRRFEDG
ncbi:MarR family transcriptional regulator [Amycolatopsis tucumanensis]|uniref:MarR family transcriptional regulator n=1 Tax=Amycolatopsis tucumanensis TaxID=401106 RepID=A0ABP7HG89_9PSEU|nr:MarR family transcriptional regulator [Amycolatopsis tucumanensis]MCF6425351.1 MarR family transcriptional regulator [Amycolatopsis tucumanensis]